MLKDDKPCFTEINARLGGGVPLAIAAGVDVPALILARAAGRAVELPTPGSYAQGLYLIRFDDSFVLTEEQREQMARRHL
jgi:carbamoyl-phosphate synthase large subunit